MKKTKFETIIKVIKKIIAFAFVTLLIPVWVPIFILIVILRGVTEFVFWAFDEVLNEFP